jgi:hypothetical protein
MGQENSSEFQHFLGLLTFILLMGRIGWAPNNIPIYTQRDATLQNLFISGKCSTCFGWYATHSTLKPVPTLPR